MWVRSVIQRGPGLETVAAIRVRSYAFLDAFLRASVQHGSDRVGALPVERLCTYFKSSRALYIRSQAHRHAGLVIQTIIPNHRLTHMFVKVWLFISPSLLTGASLKFLSWRLVQFQSVPSKLK